MSSITIHNTASHHHTKTLLWLAVGCILLVNAFILGKVYVNRSAVTAELSLSERELQLPYNYGLANEDSSLRLSLRWATPSSEPISVDMDNWRWQYNHQLQLSDDHFASFQFPDCTQKTSLRQKRRAWVLVEFNGQSYADYVAQVEQYHQLVMGLVPAVNTDLQEDALTRKRKEATDFLTTATRSNSRLYVIDAAAERELLMAVQRERAAHAKGQLLIVPAELRAGYYRCDKAEKRTTEVIIDKLAVDSFYVSKQAAPGFSSTGTTKFNAEIRYGRLYEPWVNRLQPCSTGCE